MNSSVLQNQISKIKSYIGFAKKSGNIKIGADNILASKKLKLLIISNSASDNTINKLGNFANKLNLEIVIIDKKIANILFDSETIKAVGIMDASLANACKISLENLKGTVLD